MSGICCPAWKAVVPLPAGKPPAGKPKAPSGVFAPFTALKLTTLPICSRRLTPSSGEIVAGEAGAQGRAADAADLPAAADAVFRRDRCGEAGDAGPAWERVGVGEQDRAGVRTAQRFI